jgi:hypothetical protein
MGGSYRNRQGSKSDGAGGNETVCEGPNFALSTLNLELLYPLGFPRSVRSRVFFVRESSVSCFSYSANSSSVYE